MRALHSMLITKCSNESACMTGFSETICSDWNDLVPSTPEIVGFTGQQCFYKKTENGKESTFNFVVI